ncbi:MAG TPA: PASTA domain-containing protein [Gaiellaceae bacterium]|nr:PASTA domain-containing protein [Gaiellaceae bacterium]
MSVTMPANDWSGGGPNDWLVVRVDPTAPTAAPTATVALKSVVDVSAYWALAGGSVHAFTQPLDVTMQNSTGGGVNAATYDPGAGTWRMLEAVPTPGSLPAGWNDGYYVSGNAVHILTRHLSLFALTADIQPPASPTNVSAAVSNGNLVLSWSPPPGGGAANYIVLVDGNPVANVDATQTQYVVGPYDPNDAHTYAVVAVDSSGNSSQPTPNFRLVPNLVGLTLDQARAALIAAGFTVGDITVGNSTSPAGTVVGPVGLRIAPVGSAVGFELSDGSTVVTKNGFSVVDAKGVPLAQRKWVGVYMFGMTRPMNVTLQLVNRKHRVLRTWHTVTRGKVAIRKLLLPKAARKAGTMYTLRSTATVVGGPAVFHRTNAVRVYRSLAAMKASPRRTVDVVVAGTQLPKKLPNGTKTAQRVVAGSDSSTFTIAANRRRNVQVVVVDVDEYGVRLIHNLRLVFPGVKLIAVTNSPAKAARARRFGANVVLTKAAVKTKLAKTVSALAVPPTRTPAGRKR